MQIYLRKSSSTDLTVSCGTFCTLDMEVYRLVVSPISSGGEMHVGAGRPSIARPTHLKRTSLGAVAFKLQQADWVIMEMDMTIALCRPGCMWL